MGETTPGIFHTETGYVIIVVLAFTILLVGIVLTVYNMLRPHSTGAVGDLKAQGYGEYDEGIPGECVTSSHPGYCTDVGTQTVRSVCVPHPDTGRGCIDENGEETYMDRVTTKTCTPMCRKSAWSEQTVSACTYSTPPPGKCLSQTSKPLTTTSRECLSLDATGPNMCTYDYPFGSTAEVPDGCTLNSIGTTVSCQVGTIITETKTCNADLEESSQYACGMYLVRSTPVMYTKVSDSYAVAPPTYDVCSSSSAAGEPNPNCRDVNGVKYTADTDLFKSGWYSQALECVNEDGTNAYGCQKPDCVLTQDAYNLANNGEGGPKYICNDPDSQNSSPGCLQPCVYVPTTLNGAWSSPLSSIITSASIVSTTRGSRQYTLGINNIPCPVYPDGYLQGADPDHATRRPLSDCMGNPTNPLEDTQSLWIYIDDIDSNPQEHGLSCRCQRDEIIKMSSYYLIFVPTREYDSTKPGILYAQIHAIIGKDYLGVLKSVSSVSNGTTMSIATWSSSELGDRSGDEYLITANSDSIITITDVNGGAVYAPSTTDLDSDFEDQPGTSGFLSLSNITIERQVSLSKIDQLHTELIRRQTRRNPYSCNVMYSYPPPEGYPDNDTPATST